MDFVSATLWRLDVLNFAETETPLNLRQPTSMFELVIGSVTFPDKTHSMKHAHFIITSPSKPKSYNITL